MSGEVLTTSTASILLFPKSVVWATATSGLPPTENVMENGSSGSDNESLDEGYNGKNEGSSVIPMITAEVVNGEKVRPDKC